MVGMQEGRRGAYLLEDHQVNHCRKMGLHGLLTFTFRIILNLPAQKTRKLME